MIPLELQLPTCSDSLHLSGHAGQQRVKLYAKSYIENVKQIGEVAWEVRLAELLKLHGRKSIHRTVREF